MEKKIKVIAKRAYCDFEEAEISNTLVELQSFVAGPIEVVGIETDLVILCNEVGRIIGLPHNCAICGIDFCGDILLLGTDGEEFSSLPDDFIKNFPAWAAENVED